MNGMQASVALCGHNRLVYCCSVSFNVHEMVKGERSSLTCTLASMLSLLIMHGQERFIGVVNTLNRMAVYPLHCEHVSLHTGGTGEIIPHHIYFLCLIIAW